MNRDEKFRWELLENGECFARYDTKVNAESAREIWAKDCKALTFTTRDSQAPKFKWTAETVAAVGRSKKSTIETLEACAEHWQERIDSFGIDKETWWDSDHCPACRKWGLRGNIIGCGDCPLKLIGNKCCDNTHKTFQSNKTKSNAQAVLDYINKILEQEREKERKEKEWRPELGEEVEIVRGSYFCGRQGRIIGIDNDGMILLFNPAWADGHGGHPKLDRGICSVPGYPHSHAGIGIEYLRPISECKK